MAREFKKAEFDIVHGHSYHALPLYFARNARAKKFVVTPHYEGRASTRIRDFLIKLYKPLGRRIFDQSDKIIAVSKYEKQLLLKDFSIAEDKIGIIPNGVNLSEFSSLEETPREPKTILYVGRLEKYKGVQHIIETLPLLDKEFSVKIAGDGSYKPKLVDLTSKLKLNSRVKFLGSIPHREIPKIYASAGIFIVLSQYECFNIAVAEALAAKTPCIVANTSALSEWIDNKNCFGIDYPIDKAKLAELITKVIGKRASDVKLWDWDDVTQQIAKLYQEQLN